VAGGALWHQRKADRLRQAGGSSERDLIEEYLAFVDDVSMNWTAARSGIYPRDYEDGNRRGPATGSVPQDRRYESRDGLHHRGDEVGVTR